VTGGKRVAGEEELIVRYLRPLASGFGGAYGLADDCALVVPPAGEELVLTTDAVAAGVHFFPDDDPKDIGWKALAVNVSDLAGKGARPLCYQMSLAFPEAPEHAWLERFASGLAEAQAEFAIVLSGGDTDRRPGPLAITITAIGSVAIGRMVLRSGGHAGDRLFVTGTLGDAALGLKLRQQPGLAQSWGLACGAVAHLVSRYLRPMPRLGLAAALNGFASAAMDLSDGLAKDLGRLCCASGVAARLRVRDLPLSAPARALLEREPAQLTGILAGGDDYEILAAVPFEHAARFAAAAAESGVSVTQIGVLEPGEGVCIEGPGGMPLRLEKPGWDHF
jgi:thiamine-monophosphate kinase